MEEYTSESTGKVIKLLPVAYYKLPKITEKIKNEYRARGEPIDPPTYQAAIGPDKDEFQTHEHIHELNVDGTIKKSTLESEEDFKAWDEYLDANGRMFQEANLASLRFILRHGVEVDMEGDESGWEEDQEYDGIEIPEDPRDKYIHYILTEVIANPAEQRKVTAQILAMSVSGVDRELESAAKELFRNTMDQPESDENAPDEPDDQTGELEL